jgi:hypothetical protein
MYVNTHSRLRIKPMSEPITFLSALAGDRRWPYLPYALDIPAPASASSMTGVIRNVCTIWGQATPSALSPSADPLVCLEDLRIVEAAYPHTPGAALQKAAGSRLPEDAGADPATVRPA